MTRSEVSEDNAFNFHISCFFTSVNDAHSIIEGLYSVLNDCKMGLSGEQVLIQESNATSIGTKCQTSASYRIVRLCM